jgi:hypothetical protein
MICLIPWHNATSILVTAAVLVERFPPHLRTSSEPVRNFRKYTMSACIAFGSDVSMPHKKPYFVQDGLGRL